MDFIVAKEPIIEQSKITFELETPNYVKVMRNGKKIGRIYSDSDTNDKYGTPFPHDRSTYCLNSIQICGFDRMSEVWGCGPYEGKKDCVVHFMPLEDKYYKEARKRYTEYVKKFFESEIKEVQTGKELMRYSEIQERENKDITSLKSFDNWVRMEGL